jgi:hypothetical protein
MEKIQQTAALTAKNHGLKLVVLFGSTADGTARPDSDVDIAVKFRNSGYSYSELACIADELAQPFDGREIDISAINHADPLFMKQISENCSCLFEEPGEFDAFMLLAFKQYQDHRRFLELEREYVINYAKKVA